MPMRAGQLAPIVQKSGTRKKRDTERPEFNVNPPISEKVGGKKKIKKFREDYFGDVLMAPSLNALQNVDQFKHFLLSNDS